MTLLESLSKYVFERAPADKQDGSVWYLTICGMRLAQEHARGAVAEFSAGRSYSGMALDRCMFEAIVRTMDWNLRPDFAFECWEALPVFAAREEIRRTGEKRKAPLLKNTDIPPGVQRDIAGYLAHSPKAESVEVAKLNEAAERVWASIGADATQVRRTIFDHVDTPSLFVHCRAIVAEDIFDISNDGEWAIRDVSRMAEPNARVLEIVRLLMLFCQFIAPRFAYGTSAIDRVESLWSAALASHGCT